jgi:hypothetical protein
MSGFDGQWLCLGHRTWRRGTVRRDGVSVGAPRNAGSSGNGFSFEIGSDRH